MGPHPNLLRPLRDPVQLWAAILKRTLRFKARASWTRSSKNTIFRMILSSTRILNIHFLISSERRLRSRLRRTPGRECYHSFMSTSVKNIFSRMRKIHPALSLLIIALLAYGLLIPWLGFYWDDMPMSWIRYELSPTAMTCYFSTNRPDSGLLYQ